jgi:hypothetical protein
MRGPINLEAAYALLVICGIILRVASPQRSDRANDRKWLLLPLIVPAALLWTVTIPLVSDDFVHIGYALHFTPDKIKGLFTIPAGDYFFRPLGYLSYALDARWAGNDPARWHLAALLIHFANCTLVYVVARQTSLARFFAATAAVIFGIHGSRPEVVTWIACRFDLIATLFVLATLALFLSGRYWLALLTALLALISKEAAYVLPVLLLLVTDRPRWRRVLPFAALTTAVFLYRWHLLSGIGGYQTASHTPAILNFNIWRTATALLLRLWATLFFPINWSQSAEWWLWLALIAGIAGYAAIGWSGGRERRTIAFLLFTFVCALPVQQLLLIGRDLEKSRVLYLPSVGWALFIAAVLQTLRKTDWRVPAAISILAFQVACLEHNLVVWRGVAEVARQACDSVAASLANNSKTVTVLDLPNVLRGVYFFHKGMPDCLEIGHGVDIRRVREDGTDLVFRWDAASETVKR